MSTKTFDLDTIDAIGERLCKLKGLAELLQAAAENKADTSDISLAAVHWTMRDLAGEAASLLLRT